MSQLMLSAFGKKTIPLSEYTKDFKPYNTIVLEWDIEYQDYCSEWQPMDMPEGVYDFRAAVVVKEALIKVRDMSVKSYKKKEVPGYKVVTEYSMLDPAGAWLVYDGHEKDFSKEELKKATDFFMEMVLRIEQWLCVPESRVKLIPAKKAEFECFNCGWVTDKWKDEIICEGCGKRFWSQKMWGVK